MNETEPLGTLWPIRAHLDGARQLWLGGCDVSSLAAKYGTPLYVFCEETLRERVRAYRAAFERFYPAVSQIAYASKAYLCLALAQVMAEEGLSLDVVSGGELYVALRAGFPPERIHFHGNNKSRAELTQALDAGVGRIVIDNFQELEVLADLAAGRGPARVAVWLRLSPSLTAQTHAFIQTGHEDTKFGFSIATGEAERAVAVAMRAQGLNLVGLHAHVGSQILDPEPLAECARRLVEFSTAMRDRHGFIPRELSPGGGWGVPMTPTDTSLPVERYTQSIAEAVLQACQSAGLDLPCLVLEPGRSISARAGVAVYTVGARKEIPSVRTYVLVDGGMADNIRPALYGARYTALAVSKGPTGDSPHVRNALPAPETVTIAGKFCESGDVLIRDIDLPRLTPGDLLVIPMAGAYTLSMASNYNLATRPAVVIVKDGKPRLIQRREAYADLVARDLPLRTNAGVARGATASRPFRKYQALGNDYIVLDPADWAQEPSPELVRRICDRHLGIGADGVLWGPIATTEPFALKLFNPDGSAFEKSGNGLRIFARYLWDRRLPDGPNFVLATPAGPVIAHVLDATASMIGLEMGHISFDSQQIPADGAPREIIRECVALAGREIRVTAVNVGNPHCVVFVDDLTGLDVVGLGDSMDSLVGLARELGPGLERLPLFPKRANVQIVRVVDRHTLAIAAWERGAGYTFASGTSSCAAAGAAVRLGRCDSPVTVEMPGGNAVVDVAADWSVRLTGTVGPVFEGELSPQL
jgi:diaminopimelate decarboxylase